MNDADGEEVNSENEDGSDEYFTLEEDQQGDESVPDDNTTEDLSADVVEDFSTVMEDGQGDMDSADDVLDFELVEGTHKTCEIKCL